jgi:hypothetical protein
VKHRVNFVFETGRSMYRVETTLFDGKSLAEMNLAGKGRGKIESFRSGRCGGDSASLLDRKPQCCPSFAIGANDAAKSDVTR